VLGSAPTEGVRGDLGRFGVELQAPTEGSGLLANPDDLDNRTEARFKLLAAGADPSQINSLLGGVRQPATPKGPTNLQQNFEAFKQSNPEKLNAKGEEITLANFRTGGQTINVGNNIKPPAGFRFTNPKSPLTSDLTPIKGGPATQPTAEQEKAIGAFKAIGGMVSAMQEGLRDGIDPSSISLTATGMLRDVPVLSGMWESLNGDATKESAFLTESKNFSNTALQIMRGAQVGPKEQALFEQALPKIGMTQAAFEAALNTSIRIFNDAMQENFKQRSTGGSGQTSPIGTTGLFSGSQNTEQSNGLLSPTSRQIARPQGEETRAERLKRLGAN